MLLLQAVPEQYEYDYSEIWGDYPEESIWEDYPDQDEVSPSFKEQRINFAKYGVTEERNENDTKEVVSSVPDNIYCDLVTTLTDKCVQVSI